MQFDAMLSAWFCGSELEASRTRGGMSSALTPGASKTRSDEPGKSCVTLEALTHYQLCQTC